jgi:hypothetical protein
MTRGKLREIQRIGWRNGAPAAALLAFALLMPGCGGGGFGGPATTASSAIPATTAPSVAPAASPSTAPAATASSAAPAAASPAAPPSNPSLKDKIASFFSGATQKEPQPVANAQSDIACPYLDIRQGASTLTIPPPPPDGANEAMSLKYQGIFVRAARDCAVVSGQMVMRLGVQGRIIVGPAGGPGQVDVPLRIAVVSAPTTDAKTIVTKLIRIPVTIRASDDNADFTHIEEGLSFPMPPAGELENYIVYIGFDPVGAAAQDQAAKPKPSVSKKPKPKPSSNPNAPTG